MEKSNNIINIAAGMLMTTRGFVAKRDRGDRSPMQAKSTTVKFFGLQRPGTSKLDQTYSLGAQVKAGSLQICPALAATGAFDGTARLKHDACLRSVQKVGDRDNATPLGTL